LVSITPDVAPRFRDGRPVEVFIGIGIAFDRPAQDLYYDCGDLRAAWSRSYPDIERTRT